MNKIVDYLKENRPYFENFITRSTYNSNRIEGNTLSYADTYAILFNDNSFKVTAAPREIYEAINHKYAINYLLRHLEEPLSTGFLQDLCGWVNHNIIEVDGFRKVQVYIRGANFVPPAPSQVPMQVMYFLDNYNHSTYDPIEKAARFHIEFEHIHPFEDGNGRTGRLLINYEMLRNELPPIVIPAEERGRYFTLLQEQDVTGMTALLKQCCQQEREIMEQYREGLEQGEQRIEQGGKRP